MMKVFTVGIDQKPPVEEAKVNPEKSDTPPPGYSTTQARIPLPLGPELPRPPLPPQPIIVRKSRGYKGILLVMLAVFLMAVFALALSEMAYNRQREENFFKLRWAELKHRLGYESEGPFDYFHQRAASSIGEKFDRLMSLAKSNELPQALSAEQEPTTTTSTEAVLPEQPPVVAIDTFPMAPGSNSRQSGSSSQQTSSLEVEPPQPPPMFGNNGLINGNGPFGQLRDARLQFLRNILQKIKQHAEDIGFDGTMQVSIVEVEPQHQNGADGSDSGTNDNGNNWMQRPLLPQQQQQQQPPFPPQFAHLPQHFFPHPRPLMEDFKNSRSFLDGFGEFHQPSFMQHNQVVEPEEHRPRMFGPWAPHSPQQQPMPNEFPLPLHQQQQNGPDFMDNMPRWRQPNPFLRQPEMLFFHPIFPQQLGLRFPPPPTPNEWAQNQQKTKQQNSALPRPPAFDRWNEPQNGGGAGMFQQPQMMGGGPEQQQPQLPQQQQVQIDMPEVKPPMMINENNDKFPAQPPNQQQQPQLGQQQKKPDENWMPKWVGDNFRIENDLSNSNNENSNQQQQQTLFGAGPPAAQPPSGGVLEPKNVADNEAAAAAPLNTDGQQQQTPAESEKKESSEDVDRMMEVEAPPQPIVPQNEPQQAQQQQETKPDQELPQEQPQQQQAVAPAEQAQQQPAATEQAQQQQPKWFPEVVPSVFFQPDKSSEEIDSTEKVFEGMMENMRRMVGNMFKMDSGSAETVQVDDPNGGSGASDDVNVPKPAGQRNDQPKLVE